MNYYSDYEFLDIIGDILYHPDVQKLDEWPHHGEVTRLEHSLSVAYVCYRICKKLGFDYKAAARAGVLHDLFHYKWKGKRFENSNHALMHPIIALENAKKITKVTPMEEDIILKHMWPIVKGMPKYKETCVIIFADKYCATVEIFKMISLKLKTVR